MGVLVLQIICFLVLKVPVVITINRRRVSLQVTRWTSNKRERETERDRENMHKIKVIGKVCNFKFLLRFQILSGAVQCWKVLYGAVRSYKVGYIPQNTRALKDIKKRIYAGGNCKIGWPWKCQNLKIPNQKNAQFWK